MRELIPFEKNIFRLDSRVESECFGISLERIAFKIDHNENSFVPLH